jgi:hypothetical protein
MKVQCKHCGREASLELYFHVCSCGGSWHGPSRLSWLLSMVAGFYRLAWRL